MEMPGYETRFLRGGGAHKMELKGCMKMEEAYSKLRKFNFDSAIRAGNSVSSPDKGEEWQTFGQYPKTDRKG